MKIEEILIREGKYVGATAGVSMLPMLKSGRDLVVILPAQSRLKPLDVALYKRDGKYLLHRVIAIANGCYVLRGDNCYAEELVEEGQILGVLAGFFRKDVYCACSDARWTRYARRRVKNYPLRRFLYRVKRKVKRCFRFGKERR